MRWAKQPSYAASTDMMTETKEDVDGGNLEEKKKNDQAGGWTIVNLAGL